MAAAVIDVLRRFLPAHVRDQHHGMGRAQRRAAWAITHCRTAEMGGHLHACGKCGKREFHFYSCNHRSCPQCGKTATAQWIDRQLDRRVGAPYFMVTFTLPAELRQLFFTPQAREIYQLFFAATSSALSDTLANPRWLGAITSGFTMVLHTWNQRLHFHPHIHTGRPLLVASLDVPKSKPEQTVSCPCCGEPMTLLLRLLPAWRNTNTQSSITAPSRAPPKPIKPCA
jgi:Transposase zinc-binding domain/Putative transposase